MSLQYFLFLLASISFGIEAFHVPIPLPINWNSLGFCLITIAVWLL